METNTTKIKINMNKKVIIGIFIGIFILIITYLVISLFFINHFKYGTIINGIDVGGKSVKEAKKLIEAKSKDYELTILGRDDIKEIIKGIDIEFQYNIDDKLDEVRKKQNPYSWILGFFNKNYIKLDERISYDKKLLDKKIEDLKYFNLDDVIEPRSASLEFIDGEYSINEAIEGNKVNKEKLTKEITKVIDKGNRSIDLVALNCYEEPKYTSESKEVIEAKKKLDQYVSTNIAYNFGDSKEVLNGEIISNWISIDDEFNVNLDESYITSYVDTLASKYNTFGATRQFKTSLGTTANVLGGDYGWILNKDKEVEVIKESLKSGETIDRNPNYIQAAASRGSNDIGNTYVEINLTTQQVWYYKNGELITSGNCVTGTDKTQYATPQGTYVLKYIEKDAVLRGPGYESPVSYWMPFNWDIGLHDATWRGSFGGTIYQYDGSHGCVNLPYNVAEAIFNNIEPGVAVVCYY